MLLERGKHFLVDLASRSGLSSWRNNNSAKSKSLFGATAAIVTSSRPTRERKQGGHHYPSILLAKLRRDLYAVCAGEADIQPNALALAGLSKGVQAGTLQIVNIYHAAASCF